MNDFTIEQGNIWIETELSKIDTLDKANKHLQDYAESCSDFLLVIQVNVLANNILLLWRQYTLWLFM